jgi:Protein of unknown function (DUF2384)
MILRDSAQSRWTGMPTEIRIPLDMPLDHGSSEAEIQAMQRAILRLFDHWGVSDVEAAILLGDISPRTLQRWKGGQYGRAGVDLVARMSNLLGIHKALRLLFTDPARGYSWVKRPNDAFAGRTALMVMLDGQITDLMRVRRYLDAQRGLW